MELEFTDYARMRMHQRDILDEEVVQALESPAGRHSARDGRHEVTRRTGARSLLVVYRREGNKDGLGVQVRAIETVGFYAIVINAMWES